MNCSWATQTAGSSCCVSDFEVRKTSSQRCEERGVSVRRRCAKRTDIYVKKTSISSGSVTTTIGSSRSSRRWRCRGAASLSRVRRCVLSNPGRLTKVSGELEKARSSAPSVSAGTPRSPSSAGSSNSPKKARSQLIAEQRQAREEQRSAAQALKEEQQATEQALKGHLDDAETKIAEQRDQLNTHQATIADLNSKIDSLADQMADRSSRSARRAP